MGAVKLHEDDGIRETVSEPNLWHNPRVLMSITTGFLVGLAYALAQVGVSLFPTVLYLVAAPIGAFYFAREAFEGLLKRRKVGIELLMTAAMIGAAVFREFFEASFLAFLYSITEALEDYTLDRTRHSIKSLMKLAPKEACVIREGKEVSIPVEELRVGDVFLVRPGESIPTDGVVIEGSSSVNQATITGEPIPAEKRVGSAVFAGTLNQEGYLKVRVTKPFKENTISRIVHLVEQAQAEKGRAQKGIERFGAVYSPSIFLGAFALAAVPTFLIGSFSYWAERAVVLLVAAAPCALVVSIPVTFIAAIGNGARKGVLIKGGVHLEEFSSTRAIAFDKTGTLTTGKPAVTDVIPFKGYNRREVIALAASVERLSEHPIAQAIAKYAKENDVEPLPAQAFRALVGAGAYAEVQGAKVYVGSPRLFEENGFTDRADTIVQEKVEEIQRQGNTVVLVGLDGKIVGVVGVADRLRIQAKSAIEEISRVGVQHMVLLTGDNQLTAQAIAKELGITEFYANLKPEDKVEKVKELRALYGKVAMVGDGVNDAPALAASNVGIAMGVAGTDVALETADIALMSDDLTQLSYAFRLSRQAKKIVNQNLRASAIILTILIAMTLMGSLSVAGAVTGHELSEILVVLNGVRAARLRRA